MERLPSREEIFEKLRDCIVVFDIEGVKKATEEAIHMGISPTDVIMKGLSKGMDIVGEKYSRNEYFLAELIMAGETMKEAMSVLKPYMEKEDVPKIGTVVLGTVLGDLHDIGKNILATLLTAAGFNVIDLGVDVPPEKFIEAVKENKADILAMSALLTTTMVNMKAVIDALVKEGLRNKVKVIVGGAPLTDEFARQIGADACGKDAVEGVNICRKWMEEKRGK